MKIAYAAHAPHLRAEALDEPEVGGQVLGPLGRNPTALAGRERGEDDQLVGQVTIRRAAAGEVGEKVPGDEAADRLGAPSPGAGPVGPEATARRALGPDAEALPLRKATICFRTRSTVRYRVSPSASATTRPKAAADSRTRAFRSAGSPFGIAYGYSPGPQRKQESLWTEVERRNLGVFQRPSLKVEE